MEHIAVTARPRATRNTKGEQRQMRLQGHIPAAIYGKGIDAILLTVEAKDVARVLNSEAGVNTLIDLTLDGGRHLVKIDQVDMDPIARTLRHISLHKIARNETTKATIPIELIGTPEDVAAGTAILEPGAVHVDVKCLPEDLVAALTMDVSEMKIGDVRHVSDLQVPRGIEILAPPETSIASVHVARAPLEDVQETIDAESAEASQAEESLEAQTGGAAAS